MWSLNDMLLNNKYTNEENKQEVKKKIPREMKMKTP